MTPTPVGMRCPECARQRTRVTRGIGEASLLAAAPATFILIALNVAAYLAELATGGGGINLPSASSIENFALQGFAVSDGEWYRLVTSGFMHGTLFFHLLFNMLLLFLLGRMLEPSLGTPRFVALYLASLLCGSLGALVASDPAQFTLGASGAVFGLFGAAFVIAQLRGMTAMAAEIGVVILINLAFTIGASNISIGGHVGGLVGGALCGLMVISGERGRLGEHHLAGELIAMVALGILATAAAVAVA